MEIKKPLLTVVILMIILIVFLAFSILAPKVKANGQLGSSSPPAGHTPGVPDEIYGSATALLIEDVLPWDNDSDELALNQVGISYDLTLSSNLQSINLALYKFIILASDQPTATYVNIANDIAQIDSYVSNGGVYVAHAVDGGWNSGNWSGLQIMPGGVTHVRNSTDYIHIIDPQSPIVTGLNDTYFAGWSSSTHGYFTNVPPSAHIVMVTETYSGSGVPDPNKPTYIEYNYGSGKVLATMQTIEWGWSRIYDFVGEYRREFLLNEIMYVRARITSHPATAIWIEPATTDVAGMVIGDKLNVTAWINVSASSFVWEVTMNFDPTYFNATRAGYTAGTTSQFYAGHATIPVSPIITIGSVSIGESLIGIDSGVAGNGSLCWIELELVSLPNSTLLSIDNVDTFCLDGDLSEIASTKYNASVGTEASRPWDIDRNLVVDMADLSIAALAFGTLPGDPFWNPQGDITGPESLVPDGKVDIRDVGLIARHFGERY